MAAIHRLYEEEKRGSLSRSQKEKDKYRPQTLEKENIAVEGLFAHADAGFDSGNFREHCESKDIIPNITFNKRNGTDTENCYFDEILYRERYAIERTNAWLDSFRLLLNRFDTIVSS